MVGEDAAKLTADFQMTFRSITFLLCITVCLSSLQENNVQELRKPIDSTATVVCTGCGNGNSCVINVNNVTVDEDDYTVLDNGGLVLPADDPNIYGTVKCGGSIEQMINYKICPPNNRQYDWLSITSDVTTVTEGSTFTISGIFSQLPHSSISLVIDDESISGDDDLWCTPSNGIHNKVVYYTCFARNPSRKNLKTQLSFCGIEFCSAPLIITITERPAPPLNQSVSTSATKTHNITSSSMMTLSNVMTAMSSTTTEVIIATSSVSALSSMAISVTNTSIDRHNDDDGLSGGVIAVVIIAVIIIIFITIVVVIVIIQCYRSNNAPRPKPGSINGDLPSPHSTANSNLLAIIATDANNSDVHVDEASNPNVSTTDDDNNGDVGRDGLNGGGTIEVATMSFAEHYTHGDGQQRAELLLVSRTTMNRNSSTSK